MSLTLPAAVEAYCSWHKAAFGWHPFEALTCAECKLPVPLIEVYRCYDCALPMHQECCKKHCKAHGTDRRH